MSKGPKPSEDPPVRAIFSIPGSLIAHMDRVLKGSAPSPPYGSRSALITRLLREFLNKSTGTISGVGLYDRELLADEIQKLYESGPPRPPASKG